jgi:hypothetical protein
VLKSQYGNSYNHPHIPVQYKNNNQFRNPTCFEALSYRNRDEPEKGWAGTTDVQRQGGETGGWIIKEMIPLPLSKTLPELSRNRLSGGRKL